MYKVAIFPGHWGKDPGAIDRLNSSEDDKLFSIEAVINAAISVRVQERLRWIGTQAKLFTGSLPHKIKRAREWGPDVSISIHCDSFRDPKAVGSKVFYWRNTKISQPLARCVLYEMDKISGISCRGLAPANFYVLRKAAGPVILVECGFLSNPYEERQLNDDAQQFEIAYRIVNGLLNFLKSKND